jgi:glycyl-tRNA synthetase (class II)
LTNKQQTLLSRLIERQPRQTHRARASDGRVHGKDNDKGETPSSLKLHHSKAPIKVAVLPLAKNKPEIGGQWAKAIKRFVAARYPCGLWTTRGRHRKTYARQDEIRDALLRHWWITSHC